MMTQKRVAFRTSFITNRMKARSKLYIAIDNISAGVWLHLLSQLYCIPFFPVKPCYTQEIKGFFSLLSVFLKRARRAVIEPADAWFSLSPLPLCRYNNERRRRKGDVDLLLASLQ